MSSAALRSVRPGANPWDPPPAGRSERRARRRGALRRLFFVVVMLVALASVVWRQTVGYERERQLSAVRAELSQAEAERVEVTNRIQALQTRARITRVARERLGMHVARDEEIVMLPVPATTPAPPEAP
ncbi:MAG TPA: septum formation initiator family protein [Longimicrobium sp.]|nr:septum formation initiator family protein [Longimicrobium sp.]